MNDSDRAFLEELRRDFLVEAEEHLQTIGAGLLELEQAGTPPAETVEVVFRAAHSLKGAAHAVQLPEVASLCQALESVFAELKGERLQLKPGDHDLLQRAVDALAALIATGRADEALSLTRLLAERARGAEGDGRESRPIPPVVANPLPSDPGRLPLMEALVRPASTGDEVPKEAVPDGSLPDDGGGRASSAPSDGPARGGLGETIRIAPAKVDALLLQAEEMIGIKLALDERLGELQEARAFLAERMRHWQRGPILSGQTKAAREESPLVQEGLANLKGLAERLGATEKALLDDRRTAEGLLKGLLDGARKVLMLPSSALLQGFPRLVRDLGRELGKEVDLVLSGGDVEMDKRILEGMKDPLIHLLRNAVDHGIETPQERERAGKLRRGRLSLSVSTVEGNQVEIVLADDGKGMDGGSLRREALQKGVLSAEEAASLDEAASLALIFRSGFSTSGIITDISGRGLGMAIVQEGAESLGGKVSVRSEKGRGTTFRITLPLTLATFRGVLVEEWGRLFVIPTAKVERVTRVDRDRIGRVEQRETVTLNEAPLALVRLGQVLELVQPEKAESRRLCLVVLHSGGQSVAFAVDRVVSEQEVLLKPLGRQLLRVRNVAGATVLGSGEVVPVLNVRDLLRSVEIGSSGTALSSEGREAERRPSVLVAEDSITSRTLLKNILGAAGYDVTVAVDGQEAWEMLGRSAYDLVVSDVEMPRMDGFDLTARIRSDSRRAEIPVVLVTSLESREDRERGVDVGADAYIVKSSFDQGNLLDVLKRLL